MKKDYFDKQLNESKNIREKLIMKIKTNENEIKDKIN